MPRAKKSPKKSVKKRLKVKKIVLKKKSLAKNAQSAASQADDISQNEPQTDASLHVDEPQMEEPQTNDPQVHKDLLVSAHEVDVAEVYELEAKIEAEDAIRSRRAFRIVLAILFLLTVGAAVYILSTSDNSLPDTGVKNSGITELDNAQSTSQDKMFGDYSEAQLTAFVDSFMKARIDPPEGAPSLLNASDFLNFEEGITEANLNIENIEDYSYELIGILGPQAEDTVARVIVKSVGYWFTELEMLIIKEVDAESKFNDIGRLRISSEINNPLITASIDGELQAFSIYSMIKRKVVSDKGLANYAIVAYPNESNTPERISCGGQSPTICTLMHTTSEVLVDGVDWTVYEDEFIKGTNWQSLVLNYFIAEQNEFVLEDSFGSGAFSTKTIYRLDIDLIKEYLLYNFQESGDSISYTDLEDWTYSIGDFEARAFTESVSGENKTVSLDFEQTCQVGQGNGLDSIDIVRNQDKSNELNLTVNTCYKFTAGDWRSDKTNIYTEIYDKAGDLVYSFEQRSSAEKAASIDSTQNLLVGSEEIIFNLFGEAYIARRDGASVTVEKL